MSRLEKKINKTQSAYSKFKNEETLTPEEESLLGEHITLNGDLKYLTDEELFKDIEDKEYGFGMYPIRECFKSNIIRVYYDKNDRDKYLFYSRLTPYGLPKNSLNLIDNNGKITKIE